MKMIKTQNKPLTIEQAAAWLDVSTSHLYKLTSQGKIPHYKPNGKRIYFLEDDLLEYIQAGRVKTADEIDQEAANYLTAK